jgi:beta-glucoside PTS system EIICBA component
MPVLVAVTLAIKLGVNPYVSAVIEAALLEPNFSGLLQAKQSVDFFGIPVKLMDYSSQLLPVFLSIGVYSQIERLLTKIVPKNLKIIFVPTLSLAIIVHLQHLY